MKRMDAISQLVCDQEIGMNQTWGNDVPDGKRGPGLVQAHPQQSETRLDYGTGPGIEACQQGMKRMADCAIHKPSRFHAYTRRPHQDQPRSAIQSVFVRDVSDQDNAPVMGVYELKEEQ